MRPGLIVDNFAGGGGASTGIEAALGRHVDYAINHDAEAIAMHRANHPHTEHLTTGVWDVNPTKLCAGRQVELGWFSPDCTFFSKARGGKPFRDRDAARRRRGLAWLIPYWMKAVRPRVVMLENVEEFSDWGPLLPDGRVCPRRRGHTFRRWHKMIENLGYSIDMRELKACDYGAPTTRKRLFVIARCDGREIIFPEATHGHGALPYRTAAECIDWSIPCPSIFTRERPLAEATLRRIARGVMRYVVNNPRPFIVPLTHHGEFRAQSIDSPLPTITGAHRGEHALITPLIASLAHGDSGGRREYPIEDPLGTQHSGGNKYALISPNIINTRNGEREGQAPRVRNIRDPYPTVTAAGSQGALVTAFLAKHNGGREATGSRLDESMHTVTARDHHALVSSHLVKLKGTCRDGQPVDVPLHTIQASGLHYGEVRAFLLKYYGTEQNPRLESPLDTVTSKHRFGLVTVHGEDYQIVDIGMRMLQPRELFNAQSFERDYIINPIFNGKPLTKTAQVEKCGNSVSPVVAKALVRANVVEQDAAEVA
ncbi:MAG: DNA cytosine methyltransferase [Terriglobia bacterium]|nr:DNA cytosine methyltransferase [Terriglobia bacterium]